MKNFIKGFEKILEHYVWQVTFMYFTYFFVKELWQTEKEDFSLEKFWYFSCITLHKHAPQSLIKMFTLPKILKKIPWL